MIEQLVKVTKVTYNGSTVIVEGWNSINIDEYVDPSSIGIGDTIVIVHDMMTRELIDNLGEFNGY